MAACSSNGIQSICLFYFIIIIRDEFEFDDLKYCVLISVLRFTSSSKGYDIFDYVLFQMYC